MTQEREGIDRRRFLTSKAKGCQHQIQNFKDKKGNKTKEHKTVIHSLYIWYRYEKS